MKKQRRSIDLYRTPSELWNWLKDKGGIDTEYYDKELVDELRSILQLPSGEKLEKLLREHSISMEDFLIAFFQAVRPYGEMMRDILQLFERANAKRTGENLAIEFDFGRDIPDLKFDLSHFRDWLEMWKEVEGVFLRNLWNTELLWGLNRALRLDRNYSNVKLSDHRIQQWLDQYMNDKIWPDFTLPSPESGHAELDVRLSKTWKVWSIVVNECSKYGRDREYMLELWRASFRREGEGVESLNEAWPIELLGGLVSDHWAHSIAEAAYRQAELISSSSRHEAERHQNAQELIESIDAVIDQVPNEQFEGTNLIHELESFLNLPVWQRRHELYSVWISTQILDAFGDAPQRIHQVDGVLEFAFSGTHLATLDGFVPGLHLWAELRSPFDNPVGKGRKKAIQPDYSLITDPISNPKSSILEVECKQYRKQSTKNFSDALTDYARGRPRAQIILVNYGKAAQSILERVPFDLRNQTHIIGDMKPGAGTAQLMFKRLIMRTISGKYCLPDDTVMLSTVALSEEGFIKLTWKEQPKDLDLHLRVIGNEINYSKQGTVMQSPWAQLSNDIRSGHGPEEIQIARWINSLYVCAVHNYSKDSPLAGSAATVEFRCGHLARTVTCPDAGEGDWWLVFELDGETGELKIKNEIVGKPW